jgi:hypothetical protein
LQNETFLKNNIFTGANFAVTRLMFLHSRRFIVRFASRRMFFFGFLPLGETKNYPEEVCGETDGYRVSFRK